MGQEISHAGFSEAEFAAFQQRLREETKVLKRWFDERAFDYSLEHTGGMELEAWLIDNDCLPAPRNAEFLSTVNHADVVAELSQYNFELNSPPLILGGDFLSKTQDAIESLWSRCRHAASSLQLAPLAVGICPTVRDEMLQPQWMTTTNRYRALNAELARLRGLSPVHICIEGEEQLDYRCLHIMLEAACTSLQVHLKVNQDDAQRFYNASLLATAPLVAVAANSPFLYGQSLWAESRVPAFEQVTAAHGFKDMTGSEVGRTTMGTGFVRHSLLEPFLENLSYPILLPSLHEDARHLPHLRLHNGTLWRWVRPLIGFDGVGTPHLRLEQRVMAAGPTMVDMVANIALSQGLTLALGRDADLWQSALTFRDADDNFHACAKHGLDAQVKWRGKFISIQALLLDQLLPLGKAALIEIGLAVSELDFYFDEILHRRILTGRNGAAWQRAFVNRHGKNFQALTERYRELQTTGRPVHEWPV